MTADDYGKTLVINAEDWIDPEMAERIKAAIKSGAISPNEGGIIGLAVQSLGLRKRKSAA